MAKGSGMIHPNMATMLGVSLGKNIPDLFLRWSNCSLPPVNFQVVTCDADVAPEVWRQMTLTAVKRSFNQITVRHATQLKPLGIKLKKKDFLLYSGIRKVQID